MSRVFWDTNLYIYLFEDNEPFSGMVMDLRKKKLVRGDQLFTSTLTLGEVLVKPMSVGDMNLCQKYEKAIVATSLIVPFDPEAARGYTALRSDRSLRAPDASNLPAPQPRMSIFSLPMITGFRESVLPESNS
jgi:predicted nucleic acid-binding protein